EISRHPGRLQSGLEGCKFGRSARYHALSLRYARLRVVSNTAWCSLTGLAAVLHDFLLQVGVFLTRDQADLLQRCQVLFSLREITHHEVRLTDILVCTAVAWVELQRALIVPEGQIELTGVAVGVAEIVLDVSITRVAQ